MPNRKQQSQPCFFPAGSDFADRPSRVSRTLLPNQLLIYKERARSLFINFAEDFIRVILVLVAQSRQSRVTRAAVPAAVQSRTVCRQCLPPWTQWRAMVYQDVVATLPVPKLDDTITKYLRTLEPITAPADLDRARKLAMAFKDSHQARRLQQFLEQRAQNSHTSWLYNWWETAAYQDDRESLMINVRHFLRLQRPRAPCANSHRVHR